MKIKIIPMIAAFTAALSLASCKQPVEEIVPTVFKVDKTAIETDGENLQCQIEVTANCSWTASTEDQWIVLNGTKGNNDGTVSVYILSNDTYDARTGKIILTNSEGTNLEITVSQSQNNSLHLNGDEATISSKGGEFFIVTDANVNYEVIIPEDATWIKNLGTRSLQSFDQMFDIEENLSEVKRQTVLTFRNTELGLEKKYAISQEGHVPTLVIRHHLMDFTVPVLTGEGFTATIDWGDGMSEIYAEGATHTYMTEGEYLITIIGSKISGCEHSTMKGITEIDYSEL